MASALEIQETRDYIQLHHRPLTPGELAEIISADACASAHISQVFDDTTLSRFDWNGAVLGELDLVKSRAVQKGVRYVPFKDVSDLWMASATVGIPKPSAARIAYVVAEEMNRLVRAGDVLALERLVSAVTQHTHRALAQHYQVPFEETEVLFDDNATMALFQVLATFGLPENASILTFFDTGRVIPSALSGVNPEFLPFNFKPNIDVWNNRKEAASANVDIGPYRLHLVEHYKDDSYLSNQEIEAEVIKILQREKPHLFVLPTVTRLGRRVPFIELSQLIRTEAKTLGYDPLIILDDAQGFFRLDPERYTRERFRSRQHIKKVPSVWTYADGILLTGAKVAGALMGSGALLMNAPRYQEKQRVPFSDSPLKCRARQYAFSSSKHERVDQHNTSALGVVQTPEVLSLACVLEAYCCDAQIIRRLKELRERIVEVFKSKNGVVVLEKAKGQIGFVDSIIAFYLERLPRGGGELKQALADHQPPITLPALVDADERHYLRIAFDPTRMDEEAYFEKVESVVHAVATAIEKLISKE